MLPIRHEFRYAARSLRRSRLTSVSIVATLAICIAAVTAVYSVVDVVLVRGLPFRDADRLIWVSSVSHDRPDRPFSLPEFMDYVAQTKSARVAGFTSWNAIVDGPSGAERLQGIRVSADGLAILGATPSLGRNLTAEDDEPGAPRVIMLGYGYWQRAFGGGAQVLGRTLVLDGERVTVVGVLPRFFPLPVRDVDGVVPLDPDSDPRRHARGSVNFIRMFARLAPASTASGVDRELNAIAAGLREQFPTEYAAKIGVRVLPLQDYLAVTQRAALVMLLACVALMLAVALANVLNLLLARAIERQSETAVRLALGASRGRIAFQLLLEGVLLVSASALIGIGLARLALSYSSARLVAIVPRIDEARLSVGVVGVVLGVSAMAVFLLSLVPSLVVRTMSPYEALRGAGRSSSGSHGQSRLRSSFVVAELAIAVVITAATAALVQSLIGLQRIELGYRPDSVFVARLSMPPNAYRTPAEVARFEVAIEAALSNIPGVSAAGASSVAPLSGLLRAVPFAPAESASKPHRDWGAANYRAVTPGFFAALSARRIDGRFIEAGDDGSAPPIAVINRAFAARYYRSAADAIGREVLIDDNNSGPRSLRIVGVVNDIREDDLDGAIHPDVFIPVSQLHPDGVSLVTAAQFWAVRVRSDAAAFGPTFLRVLRTVDPRVAAAGGVDLRSFVDATLAPRRFSVSVLVAFSLIALVLTTLGVYGITAYTVEQRRREIGVRMALGATPASVAALVVGRTLRLAVGGVALGLIGAFAAGRFVSNLIFGVSSNSAVLLASVSVFLIVVALVASWLPSRRAARVDTLRALS